MSKVLNEAEWANQVFGEAELGDKRLTRRLVQIAHQIGEHTGQSLVQSCEGDEAKLEGTYRFIRNNRVVADVIAENGFKSTACLAESHKNLLAIEDRTTLG